MRAESRHWAEFAQAEMEKALEIMKWLTSAEKAFAEATSRAVLAEDGAVELRIALAEMREERNAWENTATEALAQVSKLSDEWGSMGGRLAHLEAENASLRTGEQPPAPEIPRRLCRSPKCRKSLEGRDPRTLDCNATCRGDYNAARKKGPVK
jgi:hypothetical protein